MTKRILEAYEFILNQLPKEGNTKVSLAMQQYNNDVLYSPLLLSGKECDCIIDDSEVFSIIEGSYCTKCGQVTPF